MNAAESVRFCDPRGIEDDPNFAMVFQKRQLEQLLTSLAKEAKLLGILKGKRHRISLTADHLVDLRPRR
jgi:hypothetical protein